MAGVCMGFSFLCSAGSVLLYAGAAARLGAHAVFYAFACAGLLGAAYAAARVPETRGRSLDDIRRHWNKDEPVFI